MKTKNLKSIILLLIVFCLKVGDVQSQDTVKVLFLGNSHTATNNLPQMFNYLANAAGKTVLVDASTPGGFTIQQHSSFQQSIQKITSNDWDYVVLQEQSQIPSWDTLRDSMMYPYAILLDSIIHDNNPCTQTLFFMTWAHKPGDLGIIQNGGSDSFLAMQQRLRDGYLEIADSINAVVAPAGWAWRAVRQQYPLINLYLSDQYHPEVKGTYLTACTFYSTIFQDSATGIPFYSSINAATATILQNVASITVLDSLSLWNIGLFDSIAIADFGYNSTNLNVVFGDSSTNATSYSWDFDDGNFSSLQNPNHTYLQNGIYNVKLIVSNNCSSDTIIKTLNLFSTDINRIDEFDFSVYPNPCKDILFIDFEKSLANEVDVNFFSIDGRLQLSEKFDSAGRHNSINISNLEKGVYIIQFVSERYVENKMIVVR